MANGRYGLLGLTGQYDYSGSYQPDLTSTSSPTSVVYKDPNYVPNSLVSDTNNGMLDNGVNSDYINSNLQASAWNQNLGTATGLAVSFCLP